MTNNETEYVPVWVEFVRDYKTSFANIVSLMQEVPVTGLDAFNKLSNMVDYHDLLDSGYGEMEDWEREALVRMSYEFSKDITKELLTIATRKYLNMLQSIRFPPMYEKLRRKVLDLRELEEYPMYSYDRDNLEQYIAAMMCAINSKYGKAGM